MLRNPARSASFLKDPHTAEPTQKPHRLPGGVFHAYGLGVAGLFSICHFRVRCEESVQFIRKNGLIHPKDILDFILIFFLIPEQQQVTRIAKFSFAEFPSRNTHFG